MPKIRKSHGETLRKIIKEAIKDGLEVDVMYDAIDEWLEDYFEQLETIATLELGEKKNVASICINVGASNLHYVTVPLDYVNSDIMDGYDIEDVKYQLKTLEKFIDNLNIERKKYLAYLELHK
jgi:regulator of RNase E activity RraB